MTVVAHTHPYVFGVDTHARTHTFTVIVAATGEVLATEQFPTTEAGLSRALAWAMHRTAVDLATFALDARQIAASVLPLEPHQLRRPRSR